MKIFRFSVFVFLCVCSAASIFAEETAEITPEVIKKEIRDGNFTAAKQLISQYVGKENVSPQERWDWLLQREIMDRIMLDFRGNETSVLNFIKRYYPDVTSEQLQQWKTEKSLEVMTIDGKECYFRLAAPNFFRINKEANTKKIAKDGAYDTSLSDFLREHQSAVYSEVKKSGNPKNHKPETMKVTYTLTVPADVVPDGETIRCWLPFPYSQHRRQTEIVLLHSNLEHPIIAPPEYEHCTIYSEKTAVKGKPTTFQIQFQYKATAEWFDLKKSEIKPYHKESELYQKYTSERTQHIIFTDEIKQLSEKIVGDEKEPAVILQKIYDYLTSNYPWAGSREYSTMANIPLYVLENKHGDCGMLALTLITLCRYNGIPAKWQSGFMMHPNHAGMHDWAEVYFEGVGWIPVDPSLGERKIFDKTQEPELASYFMSGIDAYRWIVNEDYSRPLYPAKIYPRSETVDFQRGEAEWRGGNLYFNQWNWELDVEYVR